MVQVQTLRKSMLVVSFLAFSMAVSDAIEGNIVISLVNFGGTLFAIFLYYNPELLTTKSVDEVGELVPNFIQTKFLWVSLSISVLAIAVGLEELLS